MLLVCLGVLGCSSDFSSAGLVTRSRGRKFSLLPLYVKALQYSVSNSNFNFHQERKQEFLFVAAHLLPGIFLLLVGYVGCNFVLANIFLVLALGFNGAASISNLSNNQDLSPNFAGFMYGIMNTAGCASGIIISPLVEEIAGKYGVSSFSL